MISTGDTTRASTTAVQSERCFGLLGAVVVFHACVQALAIGLSLLALRHTRILALSILAASLAAAYGFWRIGPRRRNAAREDRPGVAAPRFVAIAGWAAYFILLVAVYWQHDLSYDGNLYHLPTVHFWAREGRIHWIDDSFPQAELINGYPKAVELLAFVAVQAFGSDQWAKSNLFFLPLGALGIVCLARLLGASKSWASTVGALWLLTPVCILQGSSTYVDNACGSSVVAFVASLAIAVTALKSPQTSWNWRVTLVLGASAGLCLGTKPTGIAVIGIGFLVALAYVACRFVRGKPPLRWRTGCKATGLLAASVLLCVLVGGFWHVRDFLHTGSPIYPCGLTIAGRQVFPGKAIGAIAQPELDALPELRGLPNYRKILHTWRQYEAWRPSFFFVDSRVGGLGYIWVLGCIPAVLVLLGRFLLPRHEMNRDAFLVLSIVVGGAFLLQPVNWWPRFTVWILGLGLPCFAVVAGDIWNRRGTPVLLTDVSGSGSPSKQPSLAAVRAKLPAAWVWACVIIAVLEAGLCWLSMVTGWRAMPHNRQELDRAVAIYASPKWKLLWPEMAGTVMERVLTGDDPVALGFTGNHAPPHENEMFIIGGLISPLGRRNIVPVCGDMATGKIEALREAGVRYIVWDNNHPVPPAFHDYRVESAPGFSVVVLAGERTRTQYQQTAKGGGEKRFR